jgi:signal transduction histidine kinase
MMLGSRPRPLPALRRSITLRTALIGSAVVVMLGAAFAVLVVAVEDQRSAARQALRSQEAVSAGTELETSLISLENGLRGYIATGRERLLEPFETARLAYPGQFERLTELVADAPAQQAAVLQLKAEIDDYVSLWALPLLNLAADSLVDARSVLLTGNGRARLDNMRRQFAELFARERKVAADREASGERKSDYAVALGYGGLVLLLLVAAGLWLYLRRAILRPVLEVAAATEIVAGGDLNAHVPATREDELGRLARAFNSMTDSLAVSRSDLDERTLELERSNRELEQYAQVTSHDLQAPVATIRMYGELLERRVGASDDAQTKQLLKGIRGSADHMASLIRDLLQYSRVGRGTIIREEVDTAAVVRRALENLAGPIGERGAEVHVGDLPKVIGDAGQLAQVFQNLIGNGIKFSAADEPRVGITATLEEDFCRFSVSDNGVGIDPTEAERIFDPFHRSAPTAYEGTGIGLAIARKIVAHHGGRIWARPRPDGGSVFHFTMPRTRLSSEPPAIVAATAAADATLPAASENGAAAVKTPKVPAA